MNLFPQLERYTRHYTVTYRVLAPGGELVADGAGQPGETRTETFTAMNGPSGAREFVDNCRAAGHVIVSIGASLTPHE